MKGIRAPGALPLVLVLALGFLGGCGPKHKNDPALDAKLIEACGAKDAAKVKELLDLGANPDAIEKGPVAGFSALAKGIQSAEVVKALLDHGADPNKKDDNNIVPLSYAVQSGGKPVWDLLVKAGAKTDSVDPTGSTLLHSAASVGAIEIMQELIDKGADVNKLDTLGYTPLFYAVTSSSGGGDTLATVQLLLSKGAKKDIKDKKGMTPADWAKSPVFDKNNHAAEVRKLLKP